jgi:hypothetical protein
VFDSDYQEPTKKLEKWDTKTQNNHTSCQKNVDKYRINLIKCYQLEGENEYQDNLVPGRMNCNT